MNDKNVANIVPAGGIAIPYGRKLAAALADLLNRSSLSADGSCGAVTCAGYGAGLTAEWGDGVTVECADYARLLLAEVPMARWKMPDFAPDM